MEAALAKVEAALAKMEAALAKMEAPGFSPANSERYQNGFISRGAQEDL